MKQFHGGTLSIYKICKLRVNNFTIVNTRLKQKLCTITLEQCNQIKRAPRKFYI